MIMSRASYSSVDPLAEKYYSISPYAYCLGNPITLIDPDGKDCVFSIIRNNKKEIIGIVISSTIYITGKGANSDLEARLNQMSPTVFKSDNKQNGVNISFNITYKYQEDIKDTDIKKGDNILHFDYKDYNGNEKVSHVDGRQYGPYEFPSHTGSILFNSDSKKWDEWEIFHETFHFLGLVDRYTNEYNKDLGFRNDIMSSYNSYIINDTHYRDFYNYGTNLHKSNPTHDLFINYIFIDSRNGKKTPPSDTDLK